MNNKRKTPAAKGCLRGPGTDHGFFQRLRENERGVWWVALLTTVTTVAFASIPETTNPTTQHDPVVVSGNLHQSAGDRVITEPPGSELASVDSSGPGITKQPYTPIVRPPVTSELRGTEPMDSQPRWSELKIRRGDNLVHLLRRAGVSAPDRRQVLLARPGSFYKLVPGRKLAVLFDSADELLKVRYQLNDRETALLVREEKGFRLDRQIWKPEIRFASAHGTIQSSLFEAAQAAGVSDRLIFDLAEIFGWDVDFALDVRRGDRFSVIYEELYRDGTKVRDGRIVAAEFVNQGLAYRAIGFDNGNGGLGYYTPDGMSVRRAFLRTPVKFSRISSRFTKRRYHPVLKRWRAHRGIDYAAPYGTPVRSTAKGRVTFKGYKGGYGNTVIIKNGGVYSTLYAHLSRFKRGIRRGSAVKQGQIIGYIGKSGMATGPHLHYEFRVNNRHQNPLRYPMPKARPISHEHHLAFLTHARQWIDNLDKLSQSVRVAER